MSEVTLEDIQLAVKYAMSRIENLNFKVYLYDEGRTVSQDQEQLSYFLSKWITEFLRNGFSEAGSYEGL